MAGLTRQPTPSRSSFVSIAEPVSVLRDGWRCCVCFGALLMRWCLAAIAGVAVRGRDPTAAALR